MSSIYIQTSSCRRCCNEGQVRVCSMSVTLLVFWYLLQAYLAARRWTISILLQCSTVWGFQTEHVNTYRPKNQTMSSIYIQTSSCIQRSVQVLILSEHNHSLEFTTWMITSCCACVGIRNNNKFSQFITYLQVVSTEINFVVKTIYNFNFNQICAKIRTSTHSFRTQSFTGIYYLKL
jgi:hypothetical protein